MSAKWVQTNHFFNLLSSVANLVSQMQTEPRVANANESDPRPDITTLAIEEEEKEGINVKERWHDDIAVGRSAGRTDEGGDRQIFKDFQQRRLFKGGRLATGELKQAEDTSQVSSGL